MSLHIILNVELCEKLQSVMHPRRERITLLEFLLKNFNKKILPSVQIFCGIFVFKW